MEILNKEYWIIESFTRRLWEPLTFKQVKKLSKNKSDNYVHKTLKKFVKAEILMEKKIGNSVLYSVNTNTKAMNILGFVAEYKSTTIKHIPPIKNIIKKINTAYYSLIITGSYARNQQNKDSDLDLVIICDDKRNPQSIRAQINFESEISIPQIHPYVFTQSQFLEMLTNKEENYGKETAKNSIIITGGKQYFDILQEAIKNGFNG